MGRGSCCSSDPYPAYTGCLGLRETVHLSPRLGTRPGEKTTVQTTQVTLQGRPTPSQGSTPPLGSFRCSAQLKEDQTSFPSLAGPLRPQR